MPFDPKPLMAENAVSEMIEMAMRAAYEQGIQEGIRRIVSAAQGAIQPQETDAKETVPVLASRASEVMDEFAKRAPRGLVQTTIAKVIVESPGLSITDYEGMVLALEPEVSAKSIGNELRRGEGTKYKRDRPNGNRWFPIDYQDEGASGSLPNVPAPSVIPFVLEGR
jgi:hypothetical protein